MLEYAVIHGASSTFAFAGNDWSAQQKKWRTFVRHGSLFGHKVNFFKKGNICGRQEQFCRSRKIAVIQ